jgi:N-acetylglucosamine-6-phosphate deacetylase
MLTLINAQIAHQRERQSLEIDAEGRISQIKPMAESEPRGKIVDLEGDWVSLGGVDLQINGGLGLAFPDIEMRDLGKLKQIADYLWQEGVDSFLPTLVTTSKENMQRALFVFEQYIQEYQQEDAQRSQVWGIHLEGPFLNYEKRGAHPAQYLLNPSLEALEDVVGEYLPLVKIMTLAPELDINTEVIEYLHQRGVIVSLGHSQASEAEANRAFAAGATMITHAYNAMPPLHHRKPGLLAAAILNPQVYAGFIADGKHVEPSMLKIFLKASDFDAGAFLVSDALAPMGLEDGIYPWDNRQIEVIGGTAKLKNGVLAGTTLPLLQGVKNLVEWGVCEVGVAIALASEAPRKALGLGGLGVGVRANLLRWHYAEEKKELTWQRLNIAKCIEADT